MVLSFVCALALAAGSAGVQPTPPPTSPPPGTADALRIQSMVLEDETAPVAVPEPSEQAMRYYRSGNVLWFVEQAWSIVVLVLLLATGLSAALRNAARRIGRNWFFTIVVYFALFTIVTTIVDLPLSYYTEYVREHAYGLSNQTFGKWFGDTLKSLAVACIVGGLVMWVPYLLLRKSPRRWWLYTAIALVPFIVLANLVAPIWIAPLFNKFEPMQDKALEQKILTLADRAGIEGSRVYQVNKSVDTKTLNAYVAGLFGTKRIVLWDTTLKRMTDRELLFVMGHEMGHYVLNHGLRLTVYLSLVLLLGFYVVHRTFDQALARWGRRFGLRDRADPAALPLAIAILSLFFLLMTPLTNSMVRQAEAEADAFGLNAAQEPHGFAMAAMRLSTYRKLRPGPLEEVLFYDHPSGYERVHGSMLWLKEHQDNPTANAPPGAK